MLQILLLTMPAAALANNASGSMSAPLVLSPAASSSHGGDRAWSSNGAWSSSGAWSKAAVAGRRYKTLGCELHNACHMDECWRVREDEALQSLRE